MATSSQDNDRNNIATGVFVVKIRLDKDNVVKLASQHIQECYFIEDIFSKCIVGKLTFVDDAGMYEFGPFTGNETVAIEYGRYSTREMSFHIWKVESILPNMQAGSHISPSISLHLVDTSYEFMTSYLYSRSYDEKQRHTQVIKQILTNMIGWSPHRINLVDSLSELDKPFTIPYWNVSNTIDYLTRRAVYGADGYGYLCYNNTKNIFSVNLYPLSYLLGSSNVIDENRYVFENNKMALGTKILDWWIEGVDHSLTREWRRSVWLNYDISTKKMNKTIIDYDEYLKYNTILGKHSLFDDTYGLNKNIISNYDFINYDSVKKTRDAAYSNFIKQYNLQFLVNIIVLGNERRYAGHQIYLDWPSINQDSRSLNRTYEGVYLVKSIVHSFVGQDTNIGYTQRMVLIKNGYQNSPSKILKKSIISNTTGGRKTTEFKNE